jgi:hypothetical protein
MGLAADVISRVRRKWALYQGALVFLAPPGN